LIFNLNFAWWWLVTLNTPSHPCYQSQILILLIGLINTIDHNYQYYQSQVPTDTTLIKTMKAMYTIDNHYWYIYQYYWLQISILLLTNIIDQVTKKLYDLCAQIVDKLPTYLDTSILILYFFFNKCNNVLSIVSPFFMFQEYIAQNKMKGDIDKNSRVRIAVLGKMNVGKSGKKKFLFILHFWVFFFEFVRMNGKYSKMNLGMYYKSWFFWFFCSFDRAIFNKTLYPGIPLYRGIPFTIRYVFVA